MAHVFDSANITPVGFLMSKQLYSYALAASGNEFIQLPTDYNYRTILFGSLSAGNSPSSQLEKVTLSIDNDRKVLINSLVVSDLLKMLHGPYVEETILAMGSGSAITFYITPAYETYAVVGPMGSALAATTNVAQAQGGTISILSDASEAFQGLIRGLAPHGFLALPQGLQSDIDSWLPINNIGSLQLTIKAGSSVGSSSTAEVLTQQLRNY
jgi:hypothetical protein